LQSGQYDDADNHTNHDEFNRAKRFSLAHDLLINRMD
jgi:hypothetical protein